MANYVTKKECKRMREAYEQGYALPDIADGTGYITDTVRRHVKDQCKHEAEEDYQLARECPFCGETIPKFPDHIPTQCEGLA